MQPPAYLLPQSGGGSQKKGTDRQARTACRRQAPSETTNREVFSESGWLLAILRRETRPQNDVNHSGCVRAHGDVRDAHRECLRMCMQGQHAIFR